MTPFKQATGSDQERFVIRLLAFIATSVNPLIIVGLEVIGIPIIKRNFPGWKRIGRKKSHMVLHTEDTCTLLPVTSDGRQKFSD